jgi:hypothetical protein
MASVYATRYPLNITEPIMIEPIPRSSKAMFEKTLLNSIVFMYTSIGVWVDRSRLKRFKLCFWISVRRE